MNVRTDVGSKDGGSSLTIPVIRSLLSFEAIGILPMSYAVYMSALWLLSGK
jgi:hypothetical protein